MTALASKEFYRRTLHAAQATVGADTRDGDVFAQIKSLHPKRRIPIANRSIDCLPRAVEVMEEHVQHAHLRMDTTASAANDAMSEQLVRLLLVDVALVRPNETGLTPLTSFVNLALIGRLPQEAHQLLSSARLVAIPKGSGKVRPVAVGIVLRHLIDKCAMQSAIEECRHYLQPHQFANAIPCGIDAIVHHTRELVRAHGHRPHLAHVAIVANNAFNMVERQNMLQAVRAHAPSLARWTYYIYGTAQPLLFTRRGTIPSSKGTQQGDPTSMLLFSLTIQSLVQRISTDCKLY